MNSQLVQSYMEAGIYGIKVNPKCGRLQKGNLAYSQGAEYDYKFNGGQIVMPVFVERDKFLERYIRNHGEPSNWHKKNKFYFSPPSAENKMSLASFVSPKKS